MLELILTGWLLISGVASQYDPGVMQAVIVNRQARRTECDLPVELPRTDGFIAVEDCADIGQIWYIQALSADRQAPGGKWESFLIVDCAQPTAAKWMRANGILVEVDAETAERWDTVGAGIGVRVIRRAND